MRRALLVGVAVTALSAGGAQAQVAADTTGGQSVLALASACPDNGAFVAASTDGPVRVLDSLPAARLVAIDTSLSFSVADRRWTWSELWAVVAAGVSQAATVRAAGTPGTETARWRSCAGAAIHMRDATLHLRGASGRIRFRADLTALGTQP